MISFPQKRFVVLPCQLLGSESLLVGHGSDQHARPDHGGDGDPEGDESGPGQK
jgi:hypothetical protein